MNTYTILHYISYLAFPLFFFVLASSKCKKTVRIISAILVLTFIFWHFIEPKMVTVKKVKIETGFYSNFVVIGDIDIWYFRGKNYIQDLVKTINWLHADFVLFSWDIKAWEKKIDANLEDVLSPIKDMNTPSFYLRDSLNPISETFLSLWVVDLSIVTPKVNDINIVWVYDGTKNASNLESFLRFWKSDKVISVLKSPEFIFNLPVEISDLSFSSTSWKKFRVPFTNAYIFPSKWVFENWLYQTENGRILVTSWLWESNFPFRLFNPPEIVNIETF